MRRLSSKALQQLWFLGASKQVILNLKPLKLFTAPNPRTSLGTLPSSSSVILVEVYLKIKNKNLKQKVRTSCNWKQVQPIENANEKLCNNYFNRSGCLVLPSCLMKESS
ncbi:glycine--tRNA ligase [Platysternon megacephalum]|uniref:Glycine--tRNA ligase n=1 Tax=Platysternon megacephalum TaxID=55544 RepID=A0A4D9E515_9SAUR|nr:glycine--tRNA ligase [Platysternon megacephalum]